jgi:Do/DeqQ family serine protease
MRNDLIPWILPLITSATLVVANPAVQERGTTARPSATTLSEPTLAPLLAKAMPAVVSIGVSGHVSGGVTDDPFFGRMFGMRRQEVREVQAAGSGVIVDADKGYILTNNHLVQNADAIQVTLNDGRSIDAELVGRDAGSDVAVIRVSANGLTSLPLGNSDEMRVGDYVVAIGNPFGLTQTATHGIVSALGRSGLGITGRDGYEDFIQTDASINPGNSGGALVNLRGELVGINSAIVGPTGGSVGIGFAIPINMAQQIVRQLVDHGSVQRGQLGVVVRDFDPKLVREVKADVDHGAIIQEIQPGSAAEDAGLEVGDILLSIDGAAVRSSADVRNKIGLRQVGDTIRIEFIRDGRKRTVTAKIRSRIAELRTGNVGGPAVAALDDPRGVMTERA